MNNGKLINTNTLLVVLIFFFSQFSFCQISELDSLSALHNRIENISVSDEAAWIEFLETTRSMQEYRTKDRINIILKKVKPLLGNISSKRTTYLYELINSRNSLHKHNYQQAEESIAIAMDLRNFGTNDEMIYLNMTGAIVKYYVADYAGALEYDFKALELCNQASDKSCLTDIYNNISVIYLMTNNLTKCEEYGRKAYLIADSLDYKIAKSRAAGNLAIVFTEKKEFEKAEKWYFEDLKLETLLGDSLSISGTYNNLGKLYDLQEDYQKALSFYENALRIAELIDDRSSIVLGYQNVAWAHYKNKNYNKAEELFELAIRQTKILGNRNKLRDAYQNTSEFYEKTNRLKKALDFQKKFVALNDSIIGENNLKAISELEIKYETEKKENELLKLNKQKQEDDIVISNQNRKVKQLSLGLGGSFLLGILGFLLFKQRLQNKKQSELLLAISETQTAERKRISQDLHDSIGGSLALTKSKLQNALSKLKETPSEMEEAISALNSTSNQVRQISHNLMPGELVRFGLVPAINTLLEQLNKEELNAQLYTTQMNDRLKPIKEIQLYRIVQEAIQNVLKHAKAKNLYIHLNKHKQHLSLLIEDDGIGILPDIKEGLGFKNIEQRIKMLNGSFTVDSSENKGTTLNIQIPI